MTWYQNVCVMTYLYPKKRVEAIRAGSNNVQKFGDICTESKELIWPTLLQNCSKVQFLNGFWPSFSLLTYQKCILKLYLHKINK
jgi:hypothetical protein